MTLAETIYQKKLNLTLQQQPKHTDVHLVDSQNSSLLAV